jgi:hypothetical protein
MPAVQASDSRKPNDRRGRRRPGFDGPLHRRLFPEPATRPVLVMIGDIVAEQPSEVRFVEDDHAVEQFCTDTCEPTFRGSVLPRCSVRRARWFRSNNLHCGDDLRGESRVAVEDEAIRRRVEGERLPDLLRDPGRGRVLRDVEVRDLASTVPDHEQHVEQAERRRADDEQVHRRDDLAVVPEERQPGLPRLGPPAETVQVARHRALRDLEAEHPEFSVDTRCAPAVVGRHLPDEVPDLGIDGRSTKPGAAARYPVPVEIEAGPMPADHGVRLHDHQRVAPSRPEAAKDEPERAVGGADAGLLAPRLERGKLLAQGQVFLEQLPA